MITEKVLQELAETHGTPLFVIDHNKLRSNYATFKNYLPRVQAYYVVKANPDPAIVKTLFDLGASFDVSSMPEFRVVYENIKDMPEKERYE
jgi:ornithine decarboxylase